jgi:hypothetical protein
VWRNSSLDQRRGTTPPSSRATRRSAFTGNAPLGRPAHIPTAGDVADDDPLDREQVIAFIGKHAKELARREQGRATLSQPSSKLKRTYRRLAVMVRMGLHGGSGFSGPRWPEPALGQVSQLADHGVTEEGVDTDEQSIGPFSHKCCEGRIDLADGAGVEDLDCRGRTGLSYLCGAARRAR